MTILGTRIVPHPEPGPEEWPEVEFDDMTPSEQIVWLTENETMESLATMLVEAQQELAKVRK